ncbi:MAG: hypothetical protein LJE94_05985 [Deltaproteobacteria bacterium]|nr:hypothetical protein [Deltaproteobacteria bacterium]
MIAGDGKRFIRWNNADLFTVGVDDPDFLRSDVLVDIGSVRTLRPVCSSWENYTFTSLTGLTGNGAY